MKFLNYLALRAIGLFSLMVMVSLSLAAWAQEAAAAAPGYWDGVLKFLENPSIVIGIGIAIELVLRFIPTAKAKSLLVPAKYFIDGFVVLLMFLSKNVLDPMINGMNKTTK